MCRCPGLEHVGAREAKRQPDWVRSGETLEMTGLELAVAGLQLPVMNPETAMPAYLNTGEGR